MSRLGIIFALVLALAACSSTVETGGNGGGGGPNFPPGGGGGGGGGGADGVVWDDDVPGNTDPDAPTPPPENPNCVDEDGDSFGDECVAGPDCDDDNPMLNTYCPPCENGIYGGCPCLNEGASVACYSGDPAFLGVGACTPGQQQCFGGYWTDCEGSVEPMPEVCDYTDNDCDGEIDEGVLSLCGDCNELCVDLGAGPQNEEEFDLGDQNSSGVDTNVDGFIVLDKEKVNMQFIWIANAGENTVSKLSTETGKEMGRYKTCGNPSRTSVDLYGDVWVGCRSGGGVAKIHAHKLQCEDKNGNGTIETSEDANGDGKIQGGEMVDGDECIQFTVNPGGSCQRALGVDKDNHAWVGEWSGQTLRRLHPDDGHVVDEIGIPANPYGLVIGSDGIIWVSGRGGNKLVRVDPVTKNVQALTPNLGQCYSPYGISLDAKGRVWTANYSCWNVAYRYDPATGQWAAGDCQSHPRGIVGSLDGYVYVANDSSSKVCILNADTMQTLGYVDLGGGKSPVGITIDFSGYVWAVNQGASSATKIDAATWNIVGEYPVGSGPYTYSDMTGYLLHTFTNPTGFYQHLFGAAGLRLIWTAIIVDAFVPAGTYIKVRVRAALTEDKLYQEEWSDYFGPYPPQAFPLDLTQMKLIGAFLQVEVSLYTEENGLTPIVKSVEVKFEAGEGGL